jgi:hypothetical protein
MNCIAGLSVLMLMLIAVPSLASGSKTAADAELAAKAKKKDGILVLYAAPLRHVTLTRDLHLADTKQTAEYDNPVAAEPSAIRTEKTEAKVSEREAADLLRFIRESGFFDLTAPSECNPQERSYSYRITVWDNGKEKQVAYCSRPDAAPRPEAFAATESKIIEFAQRNAIKSTSGGK